MKKVIVLIGPNGVGKTTTAKAIIDLKSRSAMVDSDWCRFMNPFMFTDTTRQTVTENIFCLIRNYLLNREIDTVVFTHSWHGERKVIYDNVMVRLKEMGIAFEERIIILKCSLEENLRRLVEDRRDEERIKRGIENTFSFYNAFHYPSIDTTELNPDEVAQRIIDLVEI